MTTPPAPGLPEPGKPSRPGAHRPRTPKPNRPTAKPAADTQAGQLGKKSNKAADGKNSPNPPGSARGTAGPERKKNQDFNPEPVEKKAKKTEKRSLGSHAAAAMEGADSKSALKSGGVRAAKALKDKDVVGAADEGIQAGTKVAANAFAPGVGGAVAGALLNTRVGQSLSRNTARFAIGSVALTGIAIGLVLAIIFVTITGFLLMISGAGGAAACAPKSSGSGQDVSLTDQGARTNAKYIWDSLIQNGFTPEAAAGVLGNLQQESNFDPGSKEGGGPGRGIVQWGFNGGDHGSNRFNTLMEWAAANGNKDPYALKTQVEFMLKELKEYSLFDELRVQKDVLAATALFHDRYEMSNDRNVGIYYRREDYAKRWYAEFKNSSSTSPSTSPTRAAFITGFAGQLMAVVAPAIVRAEPKTAKVYWPVSPYPGSSNGHDIGVPVGTPVYAVTSGTVVTSEDLVGFEPRISVQNGFYSYGRVIKIQHDGMDGIFTYAHLSERKVKTGDKVTAGQLIGLSGETGHAYGAHLHIDINGVDGSAVPWLEAHGAVNAPAGGVPAGTTPASSGGNNDCKGGLSGGGQTEVAPKDCPRTAPVGTIRVDGDVRKLCEDAVKQATSPEAAKAILFAFANLGAPYSQDNRMGTNPNVFDCSSMVGRAFTSGGAKIKTASGTADWLSLFGFTGAYMPSNYEGTNLKRVPDKASMKSGDIIIQFNGSDPGSSAGNAGHAQIFIGNGNVIQSSGPLNVAPFGNGWFSNEWYFRYTPA